jgi:hypothetical protein
MRCLFQPRDVPSRQLYLRNRPGHIRPHRSNRAFAQAAHKPLPPVPEKATLFHVFPYLSRLAISEPRVLLRLIAAIFALLLAKSSGVRGSCIMTNLESRTHGKHLPYCWNHELNTCASFANRKGVQCSLELADSVS